MPHTEHELRSGMLSYEIADFAMDEIRLTEGVTNFELIENSPSEISGRPCYRLLYSHRINSALKVKTVEFAGQIRPYNELVRYEVDIRRFSHLKASGSAVAIASAKVLVDGELIYTIKDAKVGVFLGIAYPDYPARSENSVGGIMDRSKA